MRRFKSPSINIRGVVFGVVIVCVFGTAAFGQPWDGNGTPNEPYLIYDACDMQVIGADSNYWDKHFRLCADIDLSAYTGTSFNIIGNDVNAFAGVFDGNSHTISNFTCETTSDYVGLFGYIDGTNAEIKDLTLIDPNINAGTCEYVGALAGRLGDGTVTDCCILGGSVTGNKRTGGLVGDTDGTILKCYVTSSVTGHYDETGGLVGKNGGRISNSYATGSVTGDDWETGGLAGENWNGTISSCYATGSVDGNKVTGGLVAYNWDGMILNCYATASVKGDERTGGLVGHSSGTISNCYSTGNVTGRDDTGGLVGVNGEVGTILNCYATGSVSGQYDTGGLVGIHLSGSYTKCFWDSDVNPDVNGIGSTTDPNVIGKSTTEMQTESTFTDAGWDFVGETVNGANDIWKICDGESYPQLWYEKYGGGLGEANNPYLIYTSCQMNAIGADSNDWDKHFKLMADIDLGGYTGTSFNIIGPNYMTLFTGVFDGNSHTISNFTYSSTGTDYIGLFGYVDDPNAKIKNLGLIDPNVNAGTGWNVGSLVGHLNNGTITDCNSEGGNVSGNDYVGGLVGDNTGTVSNSYATVSVSGNYSVGGLVGDNYSGTISSSYATGSVSGMGNGVGGLVGGNSGTVSNSYATVSVLGNSYVGGLIGYNSSSGTVSNSYSTGSVSGGTYVGGLVGYNSYGTISNSYADSDVNGLNYVGGLVGYDNSGDYTKSFWDNTVNPDVNGIGNGSDPNVIGESTANMQTESTFTDAGWDFVGETINGPNDIWDICEGTNYPKFVWQIPAADFLCPDGVNFIDYAFFAEHWQQSIYGVELTGDGKVNWADFAVFAEYWKLSGCGECGGADFTNDGDVDLKDLSVFAVHWLGTEYAEVDLTNDGQVGLDDLHQFTESWLAGF
jgi:hypothetical protein